MRSRSASGAASTRMASCSLPELDAIEDRLREVDRVYVVGCGTASYAAQVAAYLIQDWVGLPATMQVGSEMRYSPPPIDDRTLVIGVSQSGETADTLAPLKLAEERGATVVVVTNVVGSAITREADAVMLPAGRPGGRRRQHQGVRDPGARAPDARPAPGTAARHAQRQPAADVRPGAPQPPAAGGRDAASWHRRSRSSRSATARVRDFIYIGRGVGFPIAMEGALKLKELSYVHAEGYAAGELKHGPIALLDPETPLVAIATQGAVYEKVVSNVAEARAARRRSSPSRPRATTRSTTTRTTCSTFPRRRSRSAPVIAVLPLQLLAYEVAVARGTDVDQPRNLAKSVTVE